MRSGLDCLDQGVCLFSLMFMFGTRATGQGVPKVYLQW